MYSLQTSVQIGQASFEIRNKGDFRMVLDCFKALNDTELDTTERIYAALIIFYEDFGSLEDVLAQGENLVALQQNMMRFFNGGDENTQSNTHDYAIIDWEKDSNLVCAAVNNVAKQEIRSLDYLHWWTFLGYYMSVGESLLSTVVGIRYKIARHEKLEKHEKKFKQDNPEYFNIDLRSVSEREADAYVRALWGE